MSKNLKKLLQAMISKLNSLKPSQKILLVLFTSFTLLFSVFGAAIYSQTIDSNQAFAGNTYTCPEASTLQSDKCFAQNRVFGCPTGGVNVNGTCTPDQNSAQLINTPNCVADSDQDLANNFCFDENADDALYGTPAIPCGTFALDKQTLGTIKYIKDKGYTVADNFQTVNIPMYISAYKGGNWCLGGFNGAETGRPSIGNIKNNVIQSVNVYPVGTPRSKAGDKTLIVAKKTLDPASAYPAVGTCPVGWMEVVGSGCYQAATYGGYVVDAASIGNGDCNGQTYLRDSIFVCNFSLSGSKNDVYVMPAKGITAATSYGTIGDCQISGVTLVCSGIGADVNKNNPDTNSPKSGNGIDLLLNPNQDGWVPKAQINISVLNNTSSTIINTSSSSSSSSTSDSSSSATSSSSTIQSGDFNSVVTKEEMTKIVITCNNGQSVPVRSLTACSFVLPNNKKLPNDGLKLGIGDAEPTGTCSIASGQNVNCINVPTGNNLGDQPVMAKIGSSDKVATASKVNVVEASNQGITVRSGGSSLLAFISGIGMFAIGFLAYKQYRKTNSKFNF